MNELCEQTGCVWFDNSNVSFFKIPEDPSISFVLGAEGQEFLRISSKGFWVRGVKVRQDNGEAKKVYEAFKEFFESKNK